MIEYFLVTFFEKPLYLAVLVLLQPTEKGGHAMKVLATGIICILLGVSIWLIDISDGIGIVTLPIDSIRLWCGYPMILIGYVQVRLYFFEKFNRHSNHLDNKNINKGGEHES